jgi:threonyl-tRNA synthetase
MVVIGDKEAENGTVSLRARGRQDLGTLSQDELLEKLGSEAAG